MEKTKKEPGNRKNPSILKGEEGVKSFQKTEGGPGKNKKRDIGRQLISAVGGWVV